MFRNLRILPAALAMALLAPSVAANPDTYTILEVNGAKISSQEAEHAWKSLFPEGVAPDFDAFDEDIRQNVLRGLISESLLYKEAKRAGMPARESIKMRLKNLEKQIAIQAYIEELSDGFVTKQAIDEAYAQYVEKTKNQEEVRARHILVNSEDEAKKVAAKLKAGAAFDTVATRMSTDKSSAERGGDLGYFTKEKMVSEFSEVAFDLRPGDVSAPVKSDFGWHIIKVEDRRKVKLRPMEEVQEQLKADIRKKGVERYVDQLIAKANVKYFDAKGKRKKLTLE